jgi:hypothetical protein
MIMPTNDQPKLALGQQIVATPEALEVIEASGQSPAEFLRRHVRLEQGELSDEGSELNSESVKDGSRILSSFKTANDTRIWVITEAADDDGRRAATTLLLPEQY